jgi:thiol:disulfide interchange protein
MKTLNKKSFHFPFLLVSLCHFFLLSVLISKSFADEKLPPNIMEAHITTLKVDGTELIALNFKNYPHWHTYWLNPGDSGLPIKSSFTVDGQKVEVKNREAPIPNRFIEEGDIWANGHEGEYTYFYELPASLKGNIKLETTWLICKHICLPGSLQASFKWPWNGTVELAQVVPMVNPPGEKELQERYRNLPAQLDKNFQEKIKFSLIKSKNPDTPLLVYFQLTAPNGKISDKRNIFTPYPNLPFNYTHEFIRRDEQQGIFHITIPVEWDGEYQDPPVALPLDGKFTSTQKFDFLYTDPETGTVSRTSFSVDAFELTGEDKVQEIMSGTALEKEITSANSKLPDNTETASSSSTFFFLIMAFLGGLILNVMPCVLPVISIKLFKLSKAQGDGTSSLRRHNMLYTAGVLFSFLLLALIIVAFKSVGTQVGWGFQLQSPTFVFLMIVVLFVFAINLFGLFEFSTPGGRFFGNMNIKEGMFGDFFGGVLAVILSTPCSAPFLGTALTFAFSAPPIIILLTFLFIGLGLAFPFWIAAIFPKLIFFLPKPGMWMENVKKFLGVILLLTMAWLMDVYGALIPPGTSLARLVVILIFTFFGIYFWAKMSKKKVWKYFFAVLPVFLSIELMINLSNANEQIIQSNSKNFEVKMPGNLNWEPWSEQAMKDHAQAGRTVFIDFTAKWCVTCKVNEKLVLETSAFKQLVEERKISLLLGDWTRHDPIIGQWLKSQGYVGVPAYFIQKPDGSLIKLGETISISKIKEHLPE